ncbi:MAG: diguanylate cyclase, partial [Candidatus Aminicenantales bacterium]
EAWKAVQDNSIRLAILDWMMPKMNGLELCRKIREEKKEKYLYIILLTSRDRHEDTVKGLSAGADDYIVKPFHHLELKARLETGKRIIDLENRLIQSQKQLEELATKDSLTYLWNRRTIIILLADEIERSHREHKPVGVLMIDIDRFKEINDTYGHYVGDEVLIAVTSRLIRKVRVYDKIGRYGGDELLVVLPNCGLKTVKSIAERLRKAVHSQKVKTEAGLIEVSLSLGGTSSEVLANPTVEAMIKASDRALYQAKNKGRNSVAIGSYE